MTLLTIVESAKISATAERTYSIIADYHSGHPSILPKQFHSLEVLQGGYGSGTVIQFQVSAFGRNQLLRGEVSEPQPGRVLVENYPETGTETTFHVVPQDPGCEVTIETKMKVRSGILGKIEAWMMNRFLRSVYREELKNLNRVASKT